MSIFTIYHNPRCSKSRQTLALIEQNNIVPTIVEYLKVPLTEDEIVNLKEKLGYTSFIEMMRTKEAEFKEHGLSKNSNEDSLVKAMAASPKLIERPIVTKGEKAIMGRPPENVLDLIND
ncbi:MAG: arsenate reductase (glutaredoxin) [Alteromonadaceae bacterium]|nr:arsenate reductase (glutaredoxin) [Alteromonadaceae bacterium]